MIPYTQLTGTAEGDFAVPKYIYIDAAGDEHVFNRVKLNQDTYEYTDENGSGLIFDPTNYRLEDKSGGKMEFSKTKYRLEALEDGEGNRLEITYNGTGQISAVEDGSGRTATLRYDGLGGSSGAAAANPLLKSIAYNGTDVAEFTYSGAGKLTQISYPDGTHSEFTYGADGTLQSARDSSGYRIAYTRSGNTIVVAESTNVSKIADNSVTACAEKSGSSVTVTYAAGRTYIDTQEGKRTVHIFNAAGRSVCSYVDGNGAAGGGIEALRVTAASQNETFAAEVSCGAENRITGGGFENSASGWAANEPGIGGVSAQEHLGGAYSYRIQGDVSSHRYAEKEFLVSGDPRCLVLSAFAKADSLPANESNGALFRIGGQIVYRDGTSEEMRFADFDPYITDWQGAGLGLAKSRANAAKTVLHVKVRLEYTKNSGSAYFDGLSLREGTYARQSSESRYILEGNVADYPIEDITKITYVSEGFLAAQQWTDIPTYEGGKQLLTGEDLQKMLTQDMSSGLARIYVGGEEKANDAVVDDLFWETGRPSIYFSVQRDSGSDRKYDLLRGFVLRAGQIVETEDGTGLSVRLRTDKRGNVVETTLVGTGGKEYTTEYGYDGRSRQTTEETWRGLCKETEYSGVNIVKETLRVADETDAAERMIQNYAYANGGNYLSRLHDGRGSGNPTQYDTNFSYSHAYGRLTTVTLAGGQQLNYNYKTDGSLGSISALVDEDSCENSYNYTRGLLTKLVTNGSTGGSGASANKKVYTFEYDGFGALTKVYENGEEVRRYAYSAGSDYTGGESTYNYAAAGQVVAGGADGRIEWEKTIYTRDGAVLSVKSYATDGNGNLSGTESEIVRAVYDDSGRLTTLQDKRAGQTYSYAYDAAGRATGVTLTGRITGGTEEETDAEGRVTEKRLRLGAEERRYGYAYERDGGSAVPGGRAESAELPSGDTVSYGYDVLGRLKEKSLTLAGTGTDGGTYGGSTPDTKLRETYNYLRAPANDRTTEYVANIQYAGKNYSASAVYAYDEKGNVKSVTDGGRYTSYGYDGMSRLTRENNQALGFTKTYEYDANGNILTVKKYAYTTAVSLGTPEETAEYTYGTGARRDRLVSVVRRSGTKIIGNEEISGYDTLGNPCNYMGNVIEWEYGRRMRSCGGITYKYGADGVRTEKTVNGTVHKYYAEGETLHFETRTNAGGGMQKLWYYYDGSGICGVEYNGSVYYFQKNLQGDVTRVYDGNGNLAAQYVYDAWGNHKVLNANGTEITDESFIGNVNPIRYRGYYYDEETGLYYLQSRYYDPEVGRFINADDVDYIEPETLMGCNLYAYCGNNPVMYVDPTGTIFGFILGAFAIGALIGGGLSYISAYNDGQRGWGLFGAIAGGAIMGGAMGGILALGGAVGLASAGLMSFGMTAGTALGVSLGVGAAAGMISYSLENGLRTDREWSVGGMFKAGFVGALKGGVTFGIGVIGGKAGAFDKLALKGLLGKELVKDSVSYGIAKGLLSAAMPSFLRNLFTWSSFYLGETLTKLLFISSIASGARWLIDQIFGL